MITLCHIKVNIAILSFRPKLEKNTRFKKQTNQPKHFTSQNIENVRIKNLGLPQFDKITLIEKHIWPKTT